MGEPPDKGGGTKVWGTQQPPNHPGQSTLDPAQAGLGVSAGTTAQQRPFAQIIAEASANRNIIQLHLKRQQPTETNTTTKNLTLEDLGEFLFDILKINPEDCLGLDLTTGRYDTREVEMKPEVNVTPFLTSYVPQNFKNHLNDHNP